MSLTCYLIDDEYFALDIIKEFIRQTPGLEVIGQNVNPIVGLDTISNGQKPDILFLDIDMPELSGLSIAGLINPEIAVIFTTAHRQYAADAFDKDAVDFLLKPIAYDRFLKSLLKAKERMGISKKEINTADQVTTLFIKTGIKGQMRSLLVNDIVRVTAALDYSEIFLTDEKVIAYLTLNDLLDKLPPKKFSRIHKSHLINHQFIQTLESAQLRLNDKDKTVLPIGRTFKDAFREKMNDLLLISKRDHPA